MVMENEPDLSGAPQKKKKNAFVRVQSTLSKSAERGMVWAFKTGE